jgi:hypothetical protein
VFLLRNWGFSKRRTKKKCCNFKNKEKIEQKKNT